LSHQSGHRLRFDRQGLWSLRRRSDRRSRGSGAGYQAGAGARKGGRTRAPRCPHAAPITQKQLFHYGHGSAASVLLSRDRQGAVLVSPRQRMRNVLHVTAAGDRLCHLAQHLLARLLPADWPADSSRARSNPGDTSSSRYAPCHRGIPYSTR